MDAWKHDGRPSPDKKSKDNSPPQPPGGGGPGGPPDFSGGIGKSNDKGKNSAGLDIFGGVAGPFVIDPSGWFPGSSSSNTAGISLTGVNTASSSPSFGQPSSLPATAPGQTAPASGNRFVSTFDALVQNATTTTTSGSRFNSAFNGIAQNPPAKVADRRFQAAFDALPSASPQPATPAVQATPSSQPIGAGILGTPISQPIGAGILGTPITQPIGAGILGTPITQPIGAGILGTPITQPIGAGILGTPITQPIGAGILGTPVNPPVGPHILGTPVHPPDLYLAPSAVAQPPVPPPGVPVQTDEPSDVPQVPPPGVPVQSAPKPDGPAPEEEPLSPEQQRLQDILEQNLWEQTPAAARLRDILYGEPREPLVILPSEYEESPVPGQPAPPIYHNPTAKELSENAELIQTVAEILGQGKRNWIVTEDGKIITGEEIDRRDVRADGPDGKMRGRQGHPTLVDGEAGRLAGEMIYRPETNDWEVNVNSGRYSRGRDMAEMQRQIDIVMAEMRRLGLEVHRAERLF
jgi:hypothetical protein